MKSSLIFFALIGCALAFTPGHEYRYTYKGRLGMGIPEIKKEASGIGMISDVRIQILEENKAIVQLTNTKVGEYLGKVPCEMHAPMPIKYSSLSGHSQVLEEAFEVHFRNTEGDVMKVPKDDIEWVTNVRKAVSLMFFADSIVPTERSRKNHMSNDDTDEVIRMPLPSLHGTCETEWTYLTIGDPSDRRAVEKRMQHLKENVEKDSDKIYSFIRSIDFDRCDVRVELFRSGLTNISLATTSQFSDIMSRSSLMNYTMVGEKGRGVVLTGQQQGFITANPMGSRTDKLMSISNQTIELSSITKISKRIVLDGPTKDINHWYMEFASPFAPPTNSERVPFINYYSKSDAAYMPLLSENIVTGIQLTGDRIKGFAERLTKLIGKAADGLQTVGRANKGEISPWDTNETELTSLLYEAAKVMKGVDMKNLQNIFDEYTRDTSPKGVIMHTLFVELAASSGNGATMKVLLNNFENGKISNSRIASIFTTLPNHFTYAPVVPDLIKYVKTLSLDKNPFLTTLVYVNVAKTLNRICIDEESAKHTSHFHVFGDKQCDANQVAESFVKFLSSKFDNTHSSWERMVIMEALGNLGTSQSIDKIREVVLGSFDITTKRAAIYALISSKMESSARDKVFEILMEIVDDQTYDPYLRQISISTLMTWGPSVSWWQRLAIRSWNETNNNVGAFFYQVVKDLSETSQLRHFNESRAAQFVLPMTKPYARSPDYSYIHKYGFADEHQYVGSDYVYSVLRDERSPYPLESFHSIYHNLGGARFLLFEAALSSDLPSVHRDSDRDDTSELIRSLSGGKKSKPMDEVLKKIEQTLSKKGLRNQVTLFAKFFNNMEFLAPVNKDTIQKAFGRDAKHLMKKWMEGTEVHLTKYFDPTSIEMIIPTEVGTPFIARGNTPVIQGAEGFTQLRIKGKSHPTIDDLLRLKEVQVNITSNYKLLTKNIVIFHGLAPWNDLLIAAGVETFKGVNSPGENIFTIHNIGGDYTNVTYEFTPNFRERGYASHYFHTVPFLVQTPMWPGAEHTEYKAYKSLHLRDDKKCVSETTIPISYDHFGIKGNIHYEGDKPFPYTYGNFMEYFHRNPALLSQLLTTPSVRISASYIDVDFSQSEMQTFRTSAAHSKMLGDQKNKLFFFNALFDGPNTRYYEISGRHTEENEGEATCSLEVSRGGVPKYNLESRCYCLNMTTVSPVFDDYESLLHVLKRENVDVQFQGALTGGRTCHEKPLAKVEGKLKLSKDRKKLLTRELKDDCDFDPRNPMVGFTIDPVYDQVVINVSYDEEMPNYVKNVSYHLYDLSRGIAYPHVVFNYLDPKNKDGQIIFKGSRTIAEERWDVAVELPSEHIHFDRLRFPSSYDHIIPFIGIHPHLSHAHLSSSRLLLSTEVSKKCILTKDSVRTFDGKKFSYSPESCPTISVQNARDPEGISLRTDKSDEGIMEAQIGSANTGMTVTFSSQQLSVNGKQLKLQSSRQIIKDFNDEYFAEARKVGEYIEVEVPGNFTVKLWDDKIEVIPASNMRTMFKGMCGNFNGETRDEMVGPKSCIYSDSDLFTKAWTEYQNVGGCDRRQYQREQKEVEEYQKNCPKVSPYKNSKPLSHIKASRKVEHLSGQSKGKCTEFVYYIRSRFGNICVSQQRIARCKNSCSSEKNRVSMEVYDCWTEDAAPALLMKNLDIGYLKEKIEDAPTVTTSFRTTKASSCE